MNASTGLQSKTDCFVRGSVAQEHGQKRPSIQIVRDGESCGIEKCGQHIDIFDHGVGLNLCLHLAGPTNHHATLKALVITSPLGKRKRIALFTDDHDQGALLEAMSPDQVKALAYLVVKKSNFSKVARKGDSYFRGVHVMGRKLYVFNWVG